MTAHGASFVADHAWLADGTVADAVALDVRAGRFTRVEPAGAPGPGARRLPGLVLPGFADAHGHVFHRALRARTHTPGSFHTWRATMYAVAARLDPDRLERLATAVYAELALAGVTTVGEFHYLHHDPDGRPYPNRHATAEALVRAARAAGIRLTLLDTCYLSSGFGAPPQGVQRRFSDGDGAGWARRATAAAAALSADDVVVGAAIHSVRAVPAADATVVARWAEDRAAPLHVHLSEQPAENEGCRAATGRSPTVLLDEAGVLAERTTVVHATHLDSDDRARLGAAGATACLCPTTERDLADGIGRADLLLAAGCRLALGSDSHAVVDLLEEARAVELDLRLVTGRRGHLDAAQLATALTSDGHRCLGVPDAGRIEVGARADLVAVDLRSVRTAGHDPGRRLDAAVFAATAADVTHVVRDGEPIVSDRGHRLGDIAGLLTDAIAEVTT